MRRDAHARRRSEGAGRRAETIAAWWLRLHGWQVLARRVRTPAGEIDLVVRRRRTLAFVEVKTRPDDASAADSIAPQARRRISRAANLLVARFGRDCDDVRIDVVLVVPWRWPRHFAGAWDGDGR